MTPTQQAIISELRNAGYCVVIWTPEELGNTDIRILEDSVIEHGNTVIEYFIT